MKTKLLIFATIALIGASCNSSKTAVAESSKNNETALSNQSSGKLYSTAFNNQVNTIISQQLNIPITSIARSDIKETKNGYFLKFLNVRTGEKYIFNSDFDFSSVKIIKNTKS